MLPVGANLESLTGMGQKNREENKEEWGLLEKICYNERAMFLIVIC